MAEASKRRSYGILLVAAASIVWSTTGLFVHMLDVDLWSMLAWRSFFASLALFGVVVVQHGRGTPRAFTSLGWPGLLAIPISALSMFCFVAALKLTTVANVLTVYATVPFIAAGIAYLWMNEHVKRRVLVASAIAFVGIAIMAGTATRPQDIAGNALAFLMTLTFSIVLVMARRYPMIGMAPLNALAAALCALACVPFVTGGVPSAGQLAILALFGCTTTALAYMLFLTGGRYIPSSEAGLIAMLDVVLGPLWVWIGYAETPSMTALIGATFVVASVVWYLFAEMRDKPALQAT